MSELGFYEKYIKLSGDFFRRKPDLATPYKNEYLKKIIKDNKVYKFISFEGEISKVRTKIDTLKQNKIWFSFYKLLNDETEFQINYKVKKIANKTGCSTENIHLLVNQLTEMYDVYSLAYEYHDYMWKEYASNGNGICVVFDVTNYDFLFPVAYVEKINIDFDKMIVAGIKYHDTTLAIVPWVIKNPYNMTAGLDSTREKEVRILFCPYDTGEFNSGRIEMNIKERKGYVGRAKPYSEYGLSLAKIIVGDKCESGLIDELEAHFTEKGVPIERV